MTLVSTPMRFRNGCTEEKRLITQPQALMFVSGTIGQLMKDLSLTVCYSLGASLVVSLTFVPMACSKLLVHEEKNEGNLSKGGPLGKIMDKWGLALEKLDSGYRKLLHFSLRRKKRVFVRRSPRTK